MTNINRNYKDKLGHLTALNKLLEKQNNELKAEVKVTKELAFKRINDLEKELHWYTRRKWWQRLLNKHPIPIKAGKEAS